MTLNCQPSIMTILFPDLKINYFFIILAKWLDIYLIFLLKSPTFFLTSKWQLPILLGPKLLQIPALFRLHLWPDSQLLLTWGCAVLMSVFMFILRFPILLWHGFLGHQWRASLFIISSLVGGCVVEIGVISLKLFVPNLFDLAITIFGNLFRIFRHFKFSFLSVCVWRSTPSRLGMGHSPSFIATYFGHIRQQA